MVDIVICSMPALFVDRLPGAPALLKSAVAKAGFKAIALDLSQAFFVEQCDFNVDTYNQMGCRWRPNELATPDSINCAQEWVERSILKIKNLQPTLIGISVFTNFQHRSSLLLAQNIREHLPGVKIVMGGFGLRIGCQSLATDPGVRKIDLIKTFDQYVKDHQLADYTVHGSGLDELVKILQIETGREEFQGSLEEISGPIYDTPIPDYDDYDFKNYVWTDGVALPVTGSKGCVRSCTFCDIPGQFGKFKYRTGEHIAKEMIYLHSRYGVSTFEFTDSLVNGSLKAFREWLVILAEYNDKQPIDNRINWFGQYICRPQNQIPKDLYPLMKRSGVKSLIIGVENGNDEVLAAMKKKMTVKDVFDELENFAQENISVHMLTFSGFYNETWEMFLDNLKFLIKCQKYFITGTISQFTMGTPLFINDKMFIGQHAEELGIMIDPENEQLWTIKNDPANTFVERCRRRLISQLVLDKLGIPLSGQGISNLHSIKNSLWRQAKSHSLAVSDHRKIFDQSDLDFLIPKNISEEIGSTQVDVLVELESSAANGRWPWVKILIDEEILCTAQIVQKEILRIQKTIAKPDNLVRVKIEYFDKSKDDTVFKEGKIVEDQSVTIKKIVLNGIDITRLNLHTKLGAYHRHFDEQKLKYYQDHSLDTGPLPSLDMYENGFWQIDLKLPVLTHLLSLVSFQAPHERWPNPQLLFEIYDAISHSEEHFS